MRTLAVAVVFLALAAQPCLAQSKGSVATGSTTSDAALNRAVSAVDAKTVERNRAARAEYDRKLEENKAAQDKYQAELAAWKARVAACQAGDRSKCGK